MSHERYKDCALLNLFIPIILTNELPVLNFLAVKQF